MTVKAHRVIGLDFLPGRVRAVAVAGTGKKFNVTAMQSIILPTPEDDPTHFEPQEVAISLRDFLQSANLKHYMAAVAFQERKSILRLLSMPVMPDDELANTIRFEFDQVMEESIEEFTIDYTILGEVEGDEGQTKYSILVAIVPKNSLYPYIEAVEAAHLPLVRIDLPVIANISALHMTDERSLNRNVVVVHLEQAGGDVVLFDKGNLAFVRRITAGLSELKYTFSGAIETQEDIESIGGYKQDDYKLPDEHTDLAKPLIEMVMAEVERTLSFYKSQMQMLDYSYDELVLCGTGVWPRNLATFMDKDMDEDVKLANPLSEVKRAFTFTPEVEESMTMPQFSTALGLALESLT
ncbi:pilus assembly protein PilM [bacterium]|nr:pilus assembly protein PilM [bacterium]